MCEITQRRTGDSVDRSTFRGLCREVFLTKLFPLLSFFILTLTGCLSFSIIE